MISPTLYISKTSICVRGGEDFSLKKNSFEKSHRFLIFTKKLLAPLPPPNSYPKKQVYASKKGTTMLKCFIICLDHKHYFKKKWQISILPRKATLMQGKESTLR